MPYQTLKRTRILRYDRWVDVDENYVLTEKEAEECPNLKAWIRWGLLKEVSDDNDAEEKKSSTRRSATMEVETSDIKSDKKSADTSKPKKTVPT